MVGWAIRPFPPHLFMIPVEYKGISDEVVHELAKIRLSREMSEIEKAERTQKLVPKHLGEHRATDGLGQPIMSLDPMVYHGWANKFGTYECWKDAGFRNYMMRNFEETKVPAAKGLNGGTRIQIGYTKTSGAERMRFHKNYGE